MSVVHKKNISNSVNGKAKRNLFSLFKDKEKETEISVWRYFAINVFPLSEAEQGYRQIFKFLKKMLKTPCVYLYLSDEEGKKLVLSNSDFTEFSAWIENNKLDDRTGAELREPEIVMQSGEDFRKIGVIELLGTNVLNIPFHVNNTKFVGCLLTGPVLQPRALAKKKHFLQIFAVAAANAVNRFREIERLREQLNNIESRMNVSRRMLGSALELNRFVDLLLDLAITATGAEAGFVAMAHPRKKMLEIRAHKNLPDGFMEKINLSAEDGLLEWSPDDSEVMILRDFSFVAEFDIKSILAVPLVEKENLVGAFALINFTRNEMFSNFSLSVLTNFTEQIKLVLNNSRLFDDFTDRYFSTLVAMSEAYDHRTPETTGHSRRVADLAAEIARRMKLKKNMIENIRKAGLIHDVGMCGIADLDEEFQADYNHPEIAASMIDVLPIPSEITEAVRNHHEWFDGWGYPNGLKGDQIPISGRILALAEYIAQATTTTRFNDPLTPLKLSAELKLRKGKQFDPDVVKIFKELLNDKIKYDIKKPNIKCWKFKGEPRDVCSTCPNFQQDRYCWLNPEQNCASHGNNLCDRCYLFLEWIEQLETLIANEKIEVKDMEHQEVKRDRYTLVKLNGEIDVSVAPQLKSLLKELIQGGQENLVIDLAEVPFIDSSGLGIFVVAFKLAKSKSGDLKFVNARPEVLKVIKLTRLDRHFKLFDRIEEIEESFA